MAEKKTTKKAGAAAAAPEAAVAETETAAASEAAVAETAVVETETAAASEAAAKAEPAPEAAPEAASEAAPEAAPAVKKAARAKEKSPKVLFAAFEAVPFAKTGGLGDVAGSLPAALCKLGADVRLIMPKYGTIYQKYKEKMTHVADFFMDLSWRSLFCGIETLEHNGITIYFVDNEHYFYRDRPYGYDDDCERAAFFSKAVLECLDHIDFAPDIIHCNDWHTALIPAFLNTWYRSNEKFANIRTVFTVHNLKFQGVFSGYLIGDVLGFSVEQAENAGLRYGGDVNYMRSALAFADRLTTVSPTYAEEICSDFYGEHANDIFNSRRGVLHGILNGIDTEVLNPRTDPMIPEHYSLRSFKGKEACKAALQERLGLEVTPYRPIFAIISRLTDQKGMDLVLAIIDEVMQMDVQFVVLGVGEGKYEDKFRSMAQFMPHKFAACLYFDEPLSRQIYAGSDFMIVPSLFEPCGLTQITAMRYGTLPIVRETGGLKDTVQPYNMYDGSGTGFTFANYNAHELLYTMQHATDLFYNNKPAMKQLIRQAMKADFSWNASAGQYLQLYRELL